MNTLKKSGRTIIQPFIYTYQAGCNFPKIDSSATADDRTNFWISYTHVTEEMNHTLPSLFNMLNFNDGELNVVDCLLLRPVRAASGIIY